MLYPEINSIISSLTCNGLPGDRKVILQLLINYIQTKVSQKKEVRLNLICTHNSRRSHLAQIWAQAAAAYYQIPDVFCYSGGTEATAMFPVVAQTLRNTGFKIQQLSSGSNPIYAVKFAKNEHPVIAFSKTYDDEFNPKEDFTAIMTCSQADGGCPFIAGAEKRIAITYEDPKTFDNSPLQFEKYNERSIQIATEMFYVFSQIKN
ncbi:protein-tyrosine-phosphatase [Flavobacterium album]|uniref:Protein-tyrosine-phosphatase n=1 Tax=Flavobacterium album TaxID=2175091 RepID=A0A2S1R1U1_9FLAO|nr:protein-tyrosine-phosphatase [Flavobacterium album]AWH86549.1 protein-tyrosine-phosphatase [Flavobacterium album]